MTDEDVLAFWFQGDPNARRDQWFKADDAFDAEIRDKFGLALDAARDGALDRWATTPEGTLALVIVLDQFGRNIHRGSRQAYAGDAHARRIARNAIAGGADRHLTPVQRVFLYLPFEHSEDRADQDLSVELFDRLAAIPGFAGAAASARRVRDTVRRFGRFPQRNAILGRTTTPDEAAFLAEQAAAR